LVGGRRSVGIVVVHDDLTEVLAEKLNGDDKPVDKPRKEIGDV
jgi:hypothetical protein